MTSQEAFRHQCKPGYWLANTAPLGTPPDWREQPMPPGHDRPHERTLFGYDEHAFMQRQYK